MKYLFCRLCRSDHEKAYFLDMATELGLMILLIFRVGSDFIDFVNQVFSVDNFPGHIQVAISGGKVL